MKRIVNVSFFQKVATTIVASDEIHTEQYFLARVTHTSGHQQWRQWSTK